ncbi:hypothetical protein [Psychromonas aquimarina]|uniref:hypothetical protein n=1 Tax=Psychromonas aquimarina TaxID=444919 RepID=UPI00048AAF9E|nr:hypothetical protein [Psychromonas aquimarina]
MNRWYDKYEVLGKRLDAFNEMDQKVMDPLLKGVMDLVKEHDPSLLCYEKTFDFPLSLYRRRWYDKDPYLWLMFNTLKEADIVLLKSVEEYLVQEMDKDK